MKSILDPEMTQLASDFMVLDYEAARDDREQIITVRATTAFCPRACPLGIV